MWTLAAFAGCAPVPESVSSSLCERLPPRALLDPTAMGSDLDEPLHLCRLPRSAAAQARVEPALPSSLLEAHAPVQSLRRVVCRLDVQRHLDVAMGARERRRGQERTAGTSHKVRGEPAAACRRVDGQGEEVDRGWRRSGLARGGEGAGWRVADVRCDAADDGRRVRGRVRDEADGRRGGQEDRVERRRVGDGEAGVLQTPARSERAR